MYRALRFSLTHRGQTLFISFLEVVTHEPGAWFVNIVWDANGRTKIGSVSAQREVSDDQAWAYCQHVKDCITSLLIEHGGGYNHLCEQNPWMFWFDESLFTEDKWQTFYLTFHKNVKGDTK